MSRSAVHMKQHLPSLDGLPLFASDQVLADAIMGPRKFGEWRQAATLLEAEGLPKIDALMGGRYVPAVRAFFDKQYGLTEKAPRPRVDGREDLGAWNREKPKQRLLRRV